jgi:hypothetical protein
MDQEAEEIISEEVECLCPQDLIETAGVDPYLRDRAGLRMTSRPSQGTR